MSASTIVDGVDYGPLAGILGKWEGDRGQDVAPEPDGEEVAGYYETIVFEPAGEAENAERQVLAAVRYHLFVTRKHDGKVFHDQVGYWTWDKATGRITQSLAIPRAVALVAGGEARQEGDATVLTVAAGEDDPEWTISESPFMRENARTLGYRHTLRVAGDRLSYEQRTLLHIYGRRFDHTDRNELSRVG